MMANTSKWEHLPNAKHIDKILATVKVNTDEWATRYITLYDAGNVGYYDAGNVGYYDAMEMARSIINVDPVLKSAWCAARSDACDVMLYHAYESASDAITALIAYEDSAHLLDSSPEEIQLLVALGHPYAILMLPAVTSFHQINELA